MEWFGLQERRELATRQRELEKAKQRVAEIDRLIQKSYKDMSNGPSRPSRRSMCF